MLLEQKIKVKWNPRNINIYTSKGYVFTKIGDEFEVDIKDLSPSSNYFVKVKCDYCGGIFEKQFYARNNCINKSFIKKDSCSHCSKEKVKEVVIYKYGSVENMSKANEEKRRVTNIKKYGTKNVFANEKIKQKIINTNLKKYGVMYSQQNKNIRTKTEESCLKKYGVKNYVELFRGRFIKENSPCWKGGAKVSRVERATYEYSDWRKKVFEKDLYTCQKCGAKNCVGSSNVILNAHHIRNWKDNPDVRYDINNGVTLCEDCHNRFHSIYTKRNNTQEQIENFLLDKKLC